MKIRTNDEVVIIKGRDRGKRGRVLKILNKKDKIVVEGCNLVTKHLRRNPQNPQLGGRMQRPAPLPVCNVMLWSPSDQRGVRVRMQGVGREKARVSKKSGAVLGASAKDKK